MARERFVQDAFARRRARVFLARPIKLGPEPSFVFPDASETPCGFRHGMRQLAKHSLTLRVFGGQTIEAAGQVRVLALCGRDFRLSSRQLPLQSQAGLFRLPELVAPVGHTADRGDKLLPQRLDAALALGGFPHLYFLLLGKPAKKFPARSRFGPKFCVAAGKSRGLLFERRRARLDQAAARLAALSPRATLERGYAIVRAKDEIVRSGRAVTPGDAVDVELAEGGFGARVEDTR